MKKLIALVVVLAAVGAGAGAYFRSRQAPEPKVTTMPVTRGDVVDAVAATGTLQAVETVDVGTQVSGTVQELYADFNSIVRKGQVIAKLDPSLIQTQIEQQEANVTRSEADLERLKVGLADANQKYDRAKAMFDRNLIPRTDLETAEVNVKSADAQIRSAEASLVQAKASLNNQKVNLDHTIITAPIDGIVIARSVDQGQTVAASMNAPTLFILAADLTKMQVLANIDEADVGRMRPGQVVTFRVDAFPTETFNGLVEQVRLQPAVVQNVVTYSTVIAVPNPDLKLKPGMTANVNIEVARKTNVLRLPSAALRFRPTEEMFQVLNQEMPPEARGRGGFNAGGRNGGGGFGGRNGQGGAGQGQPGGGSGAAPAPGATPGPAPATAAAQPPAATPSAGPTPNPDSRQARNNQTGVLGAPGARSGNEGRGGGDRPEGGRGSGPGGGFGGGRGIDPNMTPEERRKAMEERLAAMSPEERKQFEEMRAARRAQGGGGGGQSGGGRGESGGTGGGGGRGGDNRESQPAAEASGRRDISRGVAASIRPGPTHATGATTIDALFGPLPVVESRGRAWLYMDKKLKAINLRLGVSDGTFTEILSGEIQQGQEVVTSMVTGLEPKVTTPGGNNANNPLMGPQRGGPGGRGPGGGGGGRGPG
jgi:HlyD family secretion protein